MSVATGADAQRLLRHDVAAARLPRDVVLVRGEDAVDYLHGQLSQDVRDLSPGEPVTSLVLEPAGRLDASVRVWRLPAAIDGAELLLDLEAGEGEALVTRLERFRLRVRVELELRRWQLVAVRGPSTPPLDALRGAADLVAEVDWAGLRGADLLGAEVAVPDAIAEVDAAALDAVRIEAGHPAMGSELGPSLDPKVIPAEAGQRFVEASVSFTKGCYTGQELVARVDSRGSNTPRNLRGLVVEGDEVPEAGTEVVVDGEVRGSLTSVARSTELGAPIALAYLHRTVEPGTTVHLGGPDGPSAAVRELPLLRG